MSGCAMSLRELTRRLQQVGLAQALVDAPDVVFLRAAGGAAPPLAPPS